MPPRQRKAQSRSPGEGTVFQEHKAACRAAKCSCPWRAKYSYTDTEGRARRKKLPVQPTKAEALAHLAKALADLHAGELPADDTLTVEQWATYYLTDIAPHGIKGKPIRARTLQGYRQKLRDHVLPVIGRKRMTRLTPEDLDRVYARMRAAGAKEAQVAGVHRIVHRMLAVAERRVRVRRNIADLIDAPTQRRKPTVTLTKEETTAALVAAVGRRNGARWGLGLGIGLRQSEALAVARDALDLKAGVLHIRYGLHRSRPEHGCGQPTQQTRRRRDGREALDDVYPCGQRQPGRCPQRVGPPPGLYVEPVKSDDSDRYLPLTDELVIWLTRHLEEQDAERQRDGGWPPCTLLCAPDPITGQGGQVDLDLLFRQPSGRPIEPRRDEHDWKDLLTAAGVPPIKLHGARHTTATLLLEEGVAVRTVQQVLGHSSHHFTANTYQHVTRRLQAQALGTLTGIMPTVGLVPGGTEAGPGTSSGTSSAPNSA